QYPTIFDGIWWAFVTGATVGYGDYVPISAAGRTIGILLMLSGAGLITFYISLFAASTIKYERDLSKGVISYKGSDHLICIGWNERTKKLVEITLKARPKMEVVLIDQSLTHLSYQHFPIHFIHGDATEDWTLKQANVKKASKVIITSNMSESEESADKYSVLSTVAVRGNNEDIPIITEILTKRQIKNAKRAGATTIIRPNDFMSTLLYHELFKDKKTKPFESILALLHEQRFIHLPLPNTLYNCSFIDVLTFYKRKGFLVIGIIRDGKWKINPNYDFLIQDGDVIIGLGS